MPPPRRRGSSKSPRSSWGGGSISSTPFKMERCRFCMNLHEHVLLQGINMISPACMCQWGRAIVQTDVLRYRRDSSQTLCLYNAWQPWVDFHIPSPSPRQPQFHTREPSVGHSAWTAWRACPSRSQCLRRHYIDIDHSHRYDGY